MADDPTRDHLVAALRQLRRAPGEFSKQRVSTDDVLREWIGEGDVDQAWNVITRLVERSRGDREGDTFAFFITCGWETPGDTLDARLKQYAKKFHVDERTALRRSDRGAIKVAQLLRNALLHDRPLAQLFVFQDGATVNSWLTVHVEEGSDWRRPHVYVNNEKLEKLHFELKGRGLGETYLRSSVQIPETRLDATAGYLEPLVSIRVVWAMPIWPAWDLTSHMIDNRLYSRLALEKDGVAEIKIYWLDEEAVRSRDRPLMTNHQR
nr:hypothetical protein [Streptomyces sp. S10(2018)]